MLSRDQLLSATKEIEPWIIDVRRRLHQCPELLYDLHETSQIVTEELKQLGIVFEAGTGGNRHPGDDWQR